MEEGAKEFGDLVSREKVEKMHPSRLKGDPLKKNTILDRRSSSVPQASSQ